MGAKFKNFFASGIKEDYEVMKFSKTNLRQKYHRYIKIQLYRPVEHKIIISLHPYLNRKNVIYPTAAAWLFYSNINAKCFRPLGHSTIPVPSFLLCPLKYDIKACNGFIQIPMTNVKVNVLV